MPAQLVSPSTAIADLTRRVERDALRAVCAELGVGEPVSFDVRLRPGVRGKADTERLGGGGARMDWCEAWDSVALPEGCSLVSEPIAGLPGAFPSRLRVPSLDAALALTGTPDTEVQAARRRGQLLLRSGGTLTRSTLTRLTALRDVDVEVLCTAVGWLANHDDVSGYTARQLPVPGMHSKWLEDHGKLLDAVTGRRLDDELKPRPPVVHLTYLDPEYLAGGGRRHDAWTAGDVHELPAGYALRVVVVVENRDSRLSFPPLAGAVVVENNGAAAAKHVPLIPWVREAGAVVYWGDMDQEGFAILSQLREALVREGTALTSILMDGPAFARYAPYGVSHDRDGTPIPGRARALTHLTEGERSAYVQVSTRGAATVRRIEQESIPLERAHEELVRLLAAQGPEVRLSRS